MVMTHCKYDLGHKDRCSGIYVCFLVISSIFILINFLTTGHIEVYVGIGGITGVVGIRSHGRATGCNMSIKNCSSSISSRRGSILTNY